MAYFADRRFLRRFSLAFGESLAVLTDEAPRSSRDPTGPTLCLSTRLRMQSSCSLPPRLPPESRVGDAWEHPGEHDSIITFLELRSDDRVLLSPLFSTATRPRSYTPTPGAGQRASGAQRADGTLVRIM